MISLTTMESWIARFARAIALIGLLGMLVLALAVVAEVLSRWLLDFPVLGVYDFSQLAIAISVSSCLPLVFIERRNISVSITDSFLGPRANSLLNGLGNLASMVLYAIMVWQLILYVQELIKVNEKTWVAYIPIAPWMAITTGLVALCVPVQAFCLIIDIKNCFLKKMEANE